MLRMSDAAALGLHATTILVDGGPPRTVRELAHRLGASEAHLAKVMQRLVKAGLVSSYRGPSGGFVLSCDPAETTLLQVYEAVEGPLTVRDCLLDERRCAGLCLLGEVIPSVNRLVTEHLSKTTLGSIGSGSFAPQIGSEPR